MALISVLIPAFNAEGFLSEAIASVVEQTIQSSIEIIVIDDGSTDGTAGVVNDLALNTVRPDLDIKYFSQNHGGAASARNHALSKCNGEIVAFLDADDCWAKDKLLNQVEVLNSALTAALVFGHMTEFVSGTGTGHRKPVQLSRGFLPSTLLTRREVFDKVGLFDTNLRVGEFVDWYSRATALGLRSIMLPEVLLRRRLHDNNMGARHQASMPDYTIALKAHLDRMRLRKTN